jgi:hypothetical protein
VRVVKLRYREVRSGQEATYVRAMVRVGANNLRDIDDR